MARLIQQFMWFVEAVHQVIAPPRDLGNRFDLYERWH
jgi:hypothetical protein